jgi:threonine dehydratase
VGLQCAVLHLNTIPEIMQTASVTSNPLTSVQDIVLAEKRLKGVVQRTPLMPNLNLCDRLNATIFLKREDLQVVRSYKIRGAYNKISSLSKSELEQGVVCASAGNHAQGVAYSCRLLGVQGLIFMPVTTPAQKVQQVKMFGREFVQIELIGDTFDDAYEAAITRADTSRRPFIHPFDDPKICEGQGTVGKEILDDANAHIDYLFVPVGGGGLASGVGSYFKQLSPQTKIIGVEPAGAAAMLKSLKAGKNVPLKTLDKFVDGAAVKRVGDHTFKVCREVLDDIITVEEGHVCSTILRLYNQDAIVVEPAGALSIAALDVYADKLEGKNVVCVVSGSNNDITRMEEIKERSLLYEGLKHYFMVKFPQRAGALKEFVAEVLGPNDDITHFEYSKKNHREKGPAVVGIELKDRNDFEPLRARMLQFGFFGEYLNERPDLFAYLV